MGNYKDGLCMIGNVQKIDNGKYDLSKYGFRRKFFPECLADKIARTKKVFGVSIDTSKTPFLGKLIQNLSWDEAHLWELAEDVYSSPFVNSAQGTALDGIGVYLTINRRPAIKNRVLLKTYGDEGTKIPKGFQVTTKDNILFETLEETVTARESIEIPAASLETGKGNNMPEETVTEIINPTFGIDRVANVDKMKEGLNSEADNELRERYKKSYSRVDGSTVPAVCAALLDIDKVVNYEVRKNVIIETVDGIPPKSVIAYVYRGEDQEVAQAIFENEAVGTRASGSKVVEVTDEKGGSHSTGSARAQVRDTRIKLVIIKNKNYKGDQAVKRVVLSYIGGRDLDGTEYPGLKLGGDVIQSRVLDWAMCMGGVVDIKAYISKDGRS